jgi:membrane protein required for colicin V production
MQNYDYLMLAVLVGATVFGFWKGMAWQIASLASLIVSYFASLKFSEQLAPVFGQQAPWNKFVAMAAIYVGTSLVIWTLLRLVSNVIDKVRLESFDKQMGGIFGFAKGVLLCIGITFFAVMLWPAQREAIIGSRSGHYIVALVNKANAVFPPEIHQVVDPVLKKIEEQLNPNYQPGDQNIRAQWPTQTQATGWQQPGPPQQAGTARQQLGWPSAEQQVALPIPQEQPQQAGYPYDASREPNPYPGPYSAEVPTSREY